MTPEPDSPHIERKTIEHWLKQQRAWARRPLKMAGLLGALAGCLVVPQAWILAWAVNAVIIDGVGLAQVLPWLLVLGGLIALRFVVGQLADQQATKAGSIVKAHVRERLLRKLQALGPAFVQERTSGELTASVVDGVEALEPYYSRYVPHMLAVAVVPLFILAFVMPRDWISGLVLLFTGPVIPVFMILIGLGTEKLNQKQWRKLAQLSGRLLDALQRLTALKLFNASAREADRLEQVSEEYRRSTMSVLRVAFLSSLMLEFFATVGIAVVAVLIGFRLLYGEMGFEVGFFALLLAPEFYAPLRQIGADYHARMEAIGAAENIVGIFDAEVTPAGHERPALGRRIAITCEGLTFAYAEGRGGLSGADLTLEAGAMTAVVGASGAGKSTLLAMVLGLRRPQAGRVMVRGEDGESHDLAQIDPAFWLEHVALVPQRPHMFAGSVRDNIAIGAPDASLETVRAAARMAGADEFIMRLANGYDTPLGEHGQTLSGGEVQRLALARAFLKDAPIVLMDEGTTGLDRETEAAVTAAVTELARERTVLVVAHRLATVALASHIAVMHEGAVVEEGTHAALAQGDTRYAGLLREAGML